MPLESRKWSFRVYKTFLELHSKTELQNSPKQLKLMGNPGLRKPWDLKIDFKNKLFTPVYKQKNFLWISQMKRVH